MRSSVLFCDLEQRRKQNMVHLSLDLEGFILQSDLFNDQGMLLLSKGHTLTPRDIQFLLNKNIFEVDAYSPSTHSESNLLSSSLSTQPIHQPSTPTYKARIKESQSQFLLALEHLEQQFDKAKKECYLDSETFFTQFDPLMDHALAQRNLFLSLASKPDQVQYLYYHSIQVGLISTIIATLLRLPEDQCKKIGRAGLFHDIGKVLVENEQEIKKHVIYGYNILRNSKDTTQEMHDAVLYHHEFADGSGYPNRSKQEQTTLVAQIVATANYFEHLCSDLRYSTSPSPYFALQGLLEAAFNGKLSLEIVTSFVSFLAPSFVGEKVMITGNLKGSIIRIEHDEPSKPTIRLESGQFINLKKHRTFFVQKVISDHLINF